MLHRIIAAAVLTAGLSYAGSCQAQATQWPDGINPWYKDAAGNIDSCKGDIPPPEANLGPDAANMRAMFDHAVEACHERKRLAALEEQRSRDERKAQLDRDRALAEAHRAYLEKHHLTAVTVLDLQANGADMVGGYVAVTGYIKVFGEDDVVIYASPDNINGVPLNIAHASASTRRFIFSHCSSMVTDCKLEVDGTVAYDTHVSVDVE